MGTVYKAEDTLLHRPVALKFLPADLTEDEESSRRFMREARATSSLDHPNICTIHEIAQADDGSWYIAMAWYDGKTLKRHLLDGPLPPEKSLDFARQIALGLGQAHEQDVVHRDIKPANLILTDRGDVKILDFGLARLLGQARLTRTGTVMGTAAYMSPEQARGEDVGIGSDVWSLGVVLYEMVAGRVPYEGESDVAMIYSVVNTDPAPLPEPKGPVGKACNDIIGHCLARDPKDRYPSAGTLAEDIDSALGGSKSTHGSKPSRSSIFAPPPRRPWRKFLPGVLVLLLLAALVLSWDSWIPDERERGPVGVAVVPFDFSGDVPDAEAFGMGLSTTITNRLAGLEEYSGRFWVVPVEEILRRKITDEEEARLREGTAIVITGNGVISGRTISLEVTVHDNRNLSQTSRVFRDFSGNLKTWQSDLPAWLIGQIDPRLDGVIRKPGGGRSTNIPASFLAYQFGLGHLTGAKGAAGDSLTDIALAYLDRAVASDSSFACAWTQLGRAVWRRHRNTDPAEVARAESYLATASRLDSTGVWPHYYLGRLRSRRGDSEEALADFRRALEVDPRHAPSLNGLATQHYWNGENNDAEAAYYRAVQARPHYPRTHRNAGVHHYLLAEYRRARENFQAMVDLVPQDYLGYNLLGAAYFEEEDYVNAEAVLKKSLEVEPSHGAYENLGTLFYYDQRYIDTIAMCRKALEYQPDIFSTWRTLAAASRFAPGYQDSVRPAFEKAMEYLQVQLDQDPQSPHLQADQASFLAILGQREESLAILEALEARETEFDLEIMFNLASTYEELGDRDRALDWLETAMSQDISFKKVDHYPVLKDLQSHPRYIALRSRYEEK